MTGSHDRILTALEAARIIYNVTDPSEEQINRVRAKLVRGYLKPSVKGRWTTTAGALADYLASQAARSRDAAGAAGVAGSSRTAVLPPREDPSFSGFYRKLLKDYFLAVALRRKTHHRTRAFQRAVLAGQILLLASVAVVLIGGARAAMSIVQPAEQTAVLAWLDDNVGKYKVIEWFPSQSGDDGLVVRVRYKYFENRKPIQTDRRFLVREGQVSQLFDSEENVP